MTHIEKIQAEYDRAVAKKLEFSEKLKLLENADLKNFHDIWMTRDQIAYWQGRAEGLTFALDEFTR
ncbi:MAG: hypothetical protein HZB31_03930 [Nitrospirae bacterium]|nr:hypothetical protein [Nitrospirota bacterium]